MNEDKNKLNMDHKAAFKFLKEKARELRARHDRFINPEYIALLFALDMMTEITGCYGLEGMITLDPLCNYDEVARWIKEVEDAQ